MSPARHPCCVVPPRLATCDLSPVRPAAADDRLHVSSDPIRRRHIGPFRAEDVAALVGMAFLGGESLLLLGDRWSDPMRTALRRVRDLILAAGA